MTAHDRRLKALRAEERARVQMEKVRAMIIAENWSCLDTRPLSVLHTVVADFTLR